MFKRLVSASAIALAVAVSTFSGALAAGAGATPSTGVTLPPSSPPLYCPPPVTSVVCSVLPTPVPCKGCSTAAPAVTAPSMMCSPEVSVVCTVLGATVCRKYACGIDASAAPAAAVAAPKVACAPGFTVICDVLAATLCRKTGCPIEGDGTASMALYCAPTLQDLQCVVNEILHPCQMRCASTAQASTATAAPRIYCDVPVLCTVLALTVCRHGCMLDLAAATPAASTARIDSPPGDPCSRQWPWPIEAVCHG